MRARLRRSEDGFTLPELLVYIILLAIVLAMVAGIMVSSMMAQRSVASTTTTTSSAQTASDSIETAIRNASGFTLAPVGSAGDQILRARVARGTTNVTWECAAWYYDSVKDEIRYTNTAAPASAGASPLIATPTSSQLATWTVLTTGVTPRSGTTIFAGTQAASALDSRLTLSFQAKHDTGASTRITTTVLSRTAVTGGTC